MKKFEHEAKKMFGKLADLKRWHDETIDPFEHADAPHNPHDDLYTLLGGHSTTDSEHRIFETMPIIREYVKSRTEGVRAKLAWQWANHSATQKSNLPDGFNTNGRSFEMDGFDITISMVPDTSPDFSFYGEFVDSEQDGAIKNPEAWTSRGNRNHHYIAYFVPTYSEAERYDDLHKTGMDKQSARLQARKDVLKDLEYAREYAPMIVTVTASRNGVELGSDTMGGMDYDDPEDGILGNGMIDNAIEYAKEALAKLIESAK